jgi:hypothetical protein
MAAKKKAHTEQPKDKRILKVYQRPDDDPDEALSKTLLKPEVTAAQCMQTWEDMHTISGLRAALVEQIDEVHSGSMKLPEARLGRGGSITRRSKTQGHALENILSY